MAYRDLRHYLDVLERKGKLRRVAKEVDKDWELACIARWVFQSLPESERFGLWFENVNGFDVPVVLGALGASREVYALALETTPEKIYEKWCHALSHPIAPRPAKEAPVVCFCFRGDHERPRHGHPERGQLPPAHHRAGPRWNPDRSDAAYRHALLP